MERVTLFCFAASYAVALGLELWHLYRRRPVHRLLANVFGSAGLIAQTTYLAVQRPPLALQYGLLLVLAWILAIFYLSESLHHGRQSWGVFVLPVLLILVLLAAVFGPRADDDTPQLTGKFFKDETRMIGYAHAVLLILAAVGVCVGFVASIMYLFQAHRLRAKALPNHGLRLPSLERLETMSRRAVTIAFPLLTAGMLLGVVLLFRHADEIADWTDPRVLASGLLWLVFALLLFVRIGLHLRGRNVAVLTILAFGLLLVTLIMPHMRGGLP